MNMSNVSLYALLSLLIVTSLEEELIYENLIDVVIMILRRCQPLGMEETVLLGGEYNDFLKRKLFDVKPVALIAESNFNALERYTMTRYSFIMYQNYRFTHFLRKAHRFVLVASSQPMLRSILQRTKDSPWANADGFFILVDKQTEQRGCINARSYLLAAWEYDLLSVVFLCIDPNDGIFYYTYNPYSNITPSSWQEVERLRGRNGHPWIIFKRKFIHDSEICKDLDFDKTTILNGYEIRLNAIQMEPYLKINLNEKGLNQFDGDNSEIIKVLFHKLKASLTIFIHNGSLYKLGSVGPNGTLEGMLTAVGEGRIDIAMNSRPLYLMWKLRYTYPHTRSALCVMTQPTEQISEFNKLIRFLSPPVIMGIFVVCILTHAILAKSEGYFRAALEVIRLIVCVAILHPPKVNSTRIFICMVFILFLNVNTLFQSHWSSLLTVPIFYHNFNSLESLKKSGYKLYGPNLLREFMGDEVLQSRYNRVDTYEACMEQVENSSRAVCVGDCLHMYHRIKDKNLHSSKMLREVIQTYITREDWPLYRRVNNIIQWMVQTGLLNKFQAKTFYDIWREGGLERQARTEGFKVMLLPQLAFSFYILGIGYTCATMVFAMELLIGRSRWKRSRKVTEQNRKRRKWRKCERMPVSD